MNFACVLIMVTAVAQAPKPPEWILKHSKTTTYYYLTPNPKIGPKLLDELLQKETLKHEWFRSRKHVVNIIAAQLGDIANGAADSVRHYEAAFAGTADQGKLIILRALRNCGDQQTRKQVARWLGMEHSEDVTVELNVLMTHLSAPKRVHVRDQEPTTPSDLDLLWANFFVTGEYAPVARVLSVFDRQPAPRPLIGPARWSLQSNLRQHPRLQQLVKKHLEDRPVGSQAVLKQLIAELKFPTGAFAADRQRDWLLRFTEGGKYTVEQNGQVVVEGSYQIKADLLTITDEKGPHAATDEAKKTGKYRWRKSNGRLQFRLVQDGSKGRELMLTLNSWLPSK